MTDTSPVSVVFVVAKGKTVLERWAVSVGESVEGIEVPDEADVTLTLTAADADALRSGVLDVSVGFMRGQVKMAGDTGALLRALPRLRGPLQVA